MKYFHCVIPSNSDFNIRVTVPYPHLVHFRFLARSLALLGHLAAASKDEAKFRVAFPAKPVLSGSSATGNQDP